MVSDAPNTAFAATMKKRLQKVFVVMMIKDSFHTKPTETNANYLRTHHRRSIGKNQISRAQCRVKSGTTAAEMEGSVEDTSASVVAGSVHAARLGMTAAKSMDALANTGAAGRGVGFGSDCSTQQQAFSGVQQSHGDSGGMEIDWADAIT